MATELWFRNPHNYINELVEAGEYNFAWDRGLLLKRRIDPIKHAELYVGKAFPWRALAIGEQGTAEYRSGDTWDRPTAVYPTWKYGDDAGILEDIIFNPVGLDYDMCSDLSLPGDERPVPGQEHRVVITNLPNFLSGVGRKAISYLKELQEEAPDCIFHIHGTYSYSVAFGMGFKSADIDGRTTAAQKRLHLGNGKMIPADRTIKATEWLRMFGFTPGDMDTPRNRCLFNIKSARWASENFDRNVKFKTVNDGDTVDFTSPLSEFQPKETKSYLSTKAKASEGDKFICNTCSLQDKCKFFREGAVCSVPGAEPTRLATFFKTRDSGQIIEGLSVLVAANTHRLERGLREEETFGELDPEVTKMMNQVFDQGVKLAKLVDPALRGGANVQVNVAQGGAAAVATGNPRQMIATVVRELENRGIPQSKQTPEMIQGVLEAMVNPDVERRGIEAIQGEVVD